MTETELLPEIAPSPEGVEGGERPGIWRGEARAYHGVETLGEECVTTGHIRHAHADISDTSVSQHRGEARSHLMWQSGVIIPLNAFSLF